VQIGNLYGNASKGMDDGFPIQKVPFIFQEVSSRWYLPTNCYLLVLDGHGPHVTLKAIKQEMDIGVDMITLLSHTLHALQPLNVFCFKPFKTTFRKERDVVMAISKYQELNKIALFGWVEKTIDQLLTKDNIRSWFTIINI
jgi:hypothetical protein